MARPRQISDEQILLGTKACVLEHGPAVSLDVVGESLGVTGPALLKRFGSRKALFLEALVPKAEPEWVRSLKAGPDGRDLEAQLEDIFRRIAHFFGEMIPCMSALRESGINPEEAHDPRKTHPAMNSVRALTGWLEQAHQLGLVRGDGLESAATAMLGAVTTRIWLGHMLKHHWSPRSQSGYLHEMALLFSRALVAPGSPSPPAVKRDVP